MASMQLCPTRSSSPCSLLSRRIATAAAAASLQWQSLRSRAAPQLTQPAQRPLRQLQQRLPHLCRSQHLSQLPAALQHCRSPCRGGSIESSNRSIPALPSGNDRGERPFKHPLTHMKAPSVDRSAKSDPFASPLSSTPPWMFCSVHSLCICPACFGMSYRERERERNITRPRAM